MTDYLVKALAYDGQIRAYAIDSTGVAQEAHLRHDTWSTSTAALGRTIAGTLLMAAGGLSGDDQLTVQIKGNGPAGKIVAVANGQGEIKAYIDNPHVALELNEQGKLDVRGAVGDDGVFQVIKDLHLREPFSGQTPIVSGELAEDFTYYMTVSEQLPSAFGLSVLVNPDESVKTSGGFMIQVMPDATDEIITDIENRISNIPMISKLMDAGETPETILNRLIGEENLHILEKMPVKFQCDCSKERFATGIISLGASEIQELIDENEAISTECHFCGNTYSYSVEDLKTLLEEATS